MVAVLCAALVVVLMWVKGLGGISWSSFSMILFILISVSTDETTGCSGNLGLEDFAIKFQ